EDHEHHGETGHEQHGAGQHAPGPGAPAAGAATAAAAAATTAAGGHGALAGETGDVAEIAGHHRQHARGQEGDQSRGGGHGDREQQGAGQSGGLEGLPEVGEIHSSRTRSIMERSVLGSMAPEMRAATRPSRSSTRVDGTALGATWPRSAYMISASGSGREG